MTISQILTSSVKNLKDHKIPSPHLEAELLLSTTIKKPREWILAHSEHKLGKLQITNYKLQITKRLKGEPLAYLTGEKEFYGLNFKINKHVLIPRPETELMVDEVIKKVCAKKKTLVVDIGTGSGCIIISIIKELINTRHKTLNTKYYATDISKNALKIARKNAKIHNINKYIKFKHGDLFEPLINKTLRSQILITANLPYLSPAQIKDSPAIRHEPKLALEAGRDGLKYYKELFEQLKKFQKISNIQYSISMFLEIDPSQSKSITSLVKKELQIKNISIKKDLRGQSRLVFIEI